MQKIIIFMLLLPAVLFSQAEIEQVLVEIEKNNTTLDALRQSVQAEKIGQRANVFLPDPEIGLNLMWGSPSIIGNRTDFNIMQTFDFPTVYSYKRKMATQRDLQIDWEYQAQRKELVYRVKRICIELIYYNALGIELNLRWQQAQRIASAYQTKFDMGEANILERNKAELNLLNAQKTCEMNEMEKKTLLSQLSELNGGKVLPFSAANYPVDVVPEDFEQWFTQAEQNNAVIQSLKQEMEINQKEIQLSRALLLPKLTVGFMSETVLGSKYQGVSIGLSVPLGEKRNAVKYTLAKKVASQSLARDTHVRFYSHLKAIHTRILDLRQFIQTYSDKLHAINNASLLKKALDMGEISLIEYIFELSLYHANLDTILKTQREMQLTILELNRY